VRSLILCLLLAGCAAQQQREVNAAYGMAQKAKADAVTACSTSVEVAECMLGVAVAFGGNGGNTPPVVQSDLSVVLNSSVLGAAVGAVRDIQVQKSSERAQIAAVNANAATAQEQTRAFRDVAVAGVTSVSNTASAGYGAMLGQSIANGQVTSTIAQAGFDSMAAQGSASADAHARAAESNAQANAEWARTVRERATYQYGDHAIVGNDNTVGDGIDQSTTGRDRDVVRNCTSGTTSSGSASGSTSGTTGATGGAVGFAAYPQSEVHCGG
jgi:hypothetical protein